jgi:hypothetical protein
LTDRAGPDQLSPRLNESAQLIAQVQGDLVAATAQHPRLPPAGVWLRENAHLLAEQIRVARRQLSRRYSRGLVHLAGGSGAGMPRVYHLVVEFIRHVDAQIDAERLGRFLTGYQTVAALRLGELWAMPLMLRLALIENVRRLALRIACRARHSEAPDTDAVSMGNTINSLRLLGEVDWKEFVETHSATEQILRKDPAGVYSRMSFASRDHYRHVVELLSRRSSCDEEQVARAAVALARNASAGSDGDRFASEAQLRHLGYYLVDRGRLELEKSIGYRPAIRERAGRIVGRHPLGWYLAVVLAGAVTFMASASWLAWRLVGGQLASIAAVLLLLVPVAVQGAIAVVNWLATLLVPPRLVFRMDFTEGIPDDCRSIVVIPTLLTRRSAIAALLEQLETAYLANRDRNLRCALLTDFVDADQSTLATDEELLCLAREGVERLNALYCAGRPGAFYLFHRPRKWNAREGVWMGYERKRGKLAALNRFLRNGAADDFSLIVGDVDQLRSVRYVITLDTDTQLPRDAARELVGCLAHPLNRAVLDPDSRRVVKGYGILQPRVAATIPHARQSTFSRVFSGEAGIDPYTSQTSDLYQDLFGEGSFIGKGIYDLEAFEGALAGRFPENRLLSHDLIEGCHARSGVASDVLLFEGCPSRLLAEMSRRHRWIRGDWQIAAWLLRMVPGAAGPAPNSLSAISRWKIFDNLRRSVTPVFLFAFLGVGWGLLPTLTAYWILLAVMSVCAPPLLMSASGLLRKPEETPWSLHVKERLANCALVLVRECVSLCILPYTAHVHLDAIVRTFYRLRVSRHGLLQWTTAADAESRTKLSCRDHYEIMWAGPVAAVGLIAGLTIVGPTALLAAGPILAAWLVGPLLAWRISQPCVVRTPQLSDAHTRSLRRWARQTWHFFDVYTSRHDHGLPPDNIQETPEWTAAARTSPTNIGMGLLAELTACDLGYLSVGRFLARVQRTLGTLSRLERHRGHFYNWYDTRTLLPALPRYISTVDSGNLWGALIVLRVGLEEFGRRSVVNPRLQESLYDSLLAIDDACRGCAAEKLAACDAQLAELYEVLAGPRPLGAGQACELLDRARHAARRLCRSVPRENVVLRQWVRALSRQLAWHEADLVRLAFWNRAGVPRPGSAQCKGGQAQQQALQRLRDRLDALDQQCVLADVPRAADEVRAMIRDLVAMLAGQRGADASARAALIRTLGELDRRAELASMRATAVLQRAASLANSCRRLSEMEFGFLFHPQRKLLAIGYNVGQDRVDKSRYDLLASESRLTSYLAISHGQLPLEHWFRLGRQMAVIDGEPVLLSWSGSMFEYLMPMLLMPSYAGTLLDSACRAAVRRQIRYARRRGVPWGISESCCHERNGGNDYRYQAFGVPGLGLARGLAAEVVVAPYASALAALFSPGEACANLAALEREGALSPYGFYDAADYTPQRQGGARRPGVCRTVMAHHSGMTLLALGRVLLGDVFSRRFLGDPRCRAHDLLLQERVPQAVRPVDPESLDLGPESGRRVARPPAVGGNATTTAEATSSR